MLIPAIAQFFRYKAIGSIVVLACWSTSDRVKFIKEISKHGLRTAFSCDPGILDESEHNFIQGVLYIKQAENDILKKVNKKRFSNTYKWLIIADELPEAVQYARYDIDMIAMHSSFNESIYLLDVYVHPRDGATLHPWGLWLNETGLVRTHDRERTLRKLNLKMYPLKIAIPMGHYSRDWYNGTIEEYLEDERISNFDSGIRCCYHGSRLLIDSLNATEINVVTELWSTDIHNDSMLVMLELGLADLSGGVLRIMDDRISRLDFVLSIWPFNVGFTFLTERESSSNMFVEPFTSGVWWSCLIIGVILVVAQRICAKNHEEQDGAYIAVIATWLQQDAGAVPAGTSGRWTFLVLSVSAMLVHAYYTSAIVSALMSSGGSGPDSLRSLADSKYAIASEDYDYMRYLYFNIKTNWDDLEYLKKRKMTSNFYQNLERGVQLIQQGDTAFHSEYNQLYANFRSFSDDEICKLQNVDTIPQILAWVTSSKHGQWSDIFRSRGGWLREVGITKRLVSHLQTIKPECRSSLLAERVNFNDVAPLLGLTALGAVLAFILLGLEILFARKWKDAKRSEGNVAILDPEEYEEFDDKL